MDKLCISTEDVKKVIFEASDKHGYFGKVYGIPEGGYHVAYLIEAMKLGKAVDSPEEADMIVDDIVDSGKTKDKWEKKYPNKKFFAVVEKQKNKINDWVVFPWEGDKEKTGREIVTRILEYSGRNPLKYNLDKILNKILNFLECIDL